ncbi:MAG: hypothetical protein K8L91_21015 [Anaerolineae bacterium]|nr:hypothetical protein [Anaerolineae bacterium]
MSSKLQALNFMMLFAIVLVLTYPTFEKIYNDFSGDGPEKDIDKKYDEIDKKYAQTLELASELEGLRQECSDKPAECDQYKIDSIISEMESLRFDILILTDEINNIRWKALYNRWTR